MGAAVRRRKPAEDPLAGVPEHLRQFDPGWLEVAAQGLDGYEEARDAAWAWTEERRTWATEHDYPGSPLEWLQANVAARRDIWRASEVWRPEHERWMTRATRHAPPGRRR